jgi:hypothetical protein
MKVSILASLLLSLSLTACGGSSTTAGPTTPKTASSDPSCPVAVAGTSVSVEDSPTGAALVFVTTGDVADVRRRVASMASMHNEHHSAMGPMPDGKDAGGAHAGHDMSGHAGHDMSGKQNDTSGHAGHDMSGHEGHDMSGGKHAGHAGGMIGVHSKATASDVEGGAKIDFVVGAADVAKIQAELRMHAQHFASGTCEMGKS